MKSNNKKSGFTLVELAIVLVIIGLIIGGVLVGQDLIKAATIRAAVTDLEKFNAAATTFRGKYNGLPGDLASAKAVEFGFSTGGDPNAAGTAGLRDANGVIESGAANPTGLGGETALFWKDLGQAALIGGSYPTIAATVLPAADVDATNVNLYMPKAKLRDSSSSHVYALAGRNYFYIAAITAVAATGVVTPTDAVTPNEGKNIDEKLDDGVPTTGVVRQHTALATVEAAVPVATPPTATDCSILPTAPAPATYNVGTAGYSAPDAVICQLQIRTSF